MLRGKKILKYKFSMKNLLANHALLPMFDFVSPSLSPRPFIKISVSRIPTSNLSSIGSFKKFKNSLKVNPNGEKQDFLAPELQFKDGGKLGTELESGDEEVKMKTHILEFDESLGKREEDEDLVKLDDMEEEKGVLSYRRGKQVMKRSSVMAKQVISIQSALSLGFVSQPWVDANSWMVKIVEVRPNLLSGEVERFVLEDTNQVGDVVLIPDESVMENEFKMVGLETLVGYNVVTPGRRNIGKVRGYTFNINSGGVESLELDSFGISIIPSSFVSTYALFVEDVLEVGADTIVVHEAAASRIQRLTKGLWDGQRVDYAIDEVNEYSYMEKQHSQSGFQKDKRRSSSQRSSRNTGEDISDWELPMDYL